MDRNREIEIGPFSLEILEKVIAQARADGASSILYSVIEQHDSCPKLKLTLNDQDNESIKNLYYILKRNVLEDTSSEEVLGRVVTTIL